MKKLIVVQYLILKFAVVPAVIVGIVAAVNYNLFRGPAN